jgi:ABC-type nitrate/sulfonate/bicarbonate transport system substrate-binding protein
VGVVKDFLLENGFIDRDFSVEDWIDPRPLAEARRLEGVG